MCPQCIKAQGCDHVLVGGIALKLLHRFEPAGAEWLAAHPWETAPSGPSAQPLANGEMPSATERQELHIDASFPPPPIKFGYRAWDLGTVAFAEYAHGHKTATEWGGVSFLKYYIA